MFGIDDRKPPVVYRNARVIPFEKAEKALFITWPKVTRCNFCNQFREHVVESTVKDPNTPTEFNKRVICFNCLKKCNQLIWKDLEDERTGNTTA